MKSISLDLRERVLADCDQKMATGDVAKKHRVSPAWVRRLKQRRRETGPNRSQEATSWPRSRVGRLRRTNSRGGPRNSGCDFGGASATAESAALAGRFGASAGCAGFVSKKKTQRASEQDRPDVKAQRETWKSARLGKRSRPEWIRRWTWNALWRSTKRGPAPT